ncbi:hypothetical protein [Bacillus sp. FJAT-29937]|nr:hypothetical protein [Bacillus sp. FJAT-29937]
MSEFLCCDRCGELSMYERTIYIDNKPICPSCSNLAVYLPETLLVEEK